jgi:glycosyltransferase EpsF
VLREKRYDAVHDHQDYASGWHFLMGGAALPRVRVTHVHNPSYQILRNYGISPLRRFTAVAGKKLVGRYATHIVGTSRQVLAEYGFDAPAFSRIPKGALHCGFDVSRFSGDKAAALASVCAEFGWPGNIKLILFAGRIDRSPDAADPQTHKNSGFAVSAAIECARRDADVRVLFAGAPSPAVPALERRIAEAGFAGRILFAGVRKDVAKLMLAGRALLFPSRGEGLGMVAVEAQAAGLPVLASTAVPRECVVVPELVRFEPLEKGAEAWGQALLELCALSPDAAAANRRVAQSPFSIDNSCRALLALYKEGVLA